MKRILVEFYSPKAPENLISILKGQYEKIFFFYFQFDKAPKQTEKMMIGDVVEQILGIRPKFSAIGEQNITAVLNELSKLLKPGITLEIDITGGNEIFIAAAGIFLSKHPDFPIYLHQYDIKSGKEVLRYPEKRDEENRFPSYLSVPQIFSLNGTALLAAPCYNFTHSTLREEILRLWQAVGQQNKQWNHFCSLPFEGKGENNLTFRKYLGEGARQNASYRVIAEKLKQAGIMKNETIFSAGPKKYAQFELCISKEALPLYEKAGTLLELYTAMAATDSDRFHDIRVGVTADWNGRRTNPGKPDPRNEIDLVFMSQNLPVVASCKNTQPQNEFLYEIMTISRHYGGPFSTAMLLSANAASPTLRQRAREMNIILIENIRKKSYEELVLLFQKLFPI